MGVGGKFWDLLKPYARHEGYDFLRNKRVAVDLSFWIVQHETAIKSYVRKPHLRLTFYRTINLFSKFGAFPVFVYDGTPSPLKSRARIARFYRSSGIDFSSIPVAEEGFSVERNGTFERMVRDCVELLQLFGMPVLKADGEAEALCAQLNSEGFVDACITADSDAFVFGANCVIKSLKPNSEEPFECYQMSDIEAGLGLKRNHLVAISLLVGNDHDLNGVQGIGVNTALRFVQTFSEEEILNSLREIGKGNFHMFQGASRVSENYVLHLDESPPKLKTSHCSFCGHPGLKRTHYKFCCECCGSGIGEGCTKKPEGFKCDCNGCNEELKKKQQQKHENWQLKVCNKISMEPNFPDEDIIEIYSCNTHRKLTEDNSPCLCWESPNVDMLVDFLVFHQLWEPSYIRQKIIPILSTIYLREMAAKKEKAMLCGQYEFDSIQRIKMRYGQKCYVIKWKKAAHTVSSDTYTRTVEESRQDEEIVEVDDSFDELEENNVLNSYIEDGCWFLLTDENMDLVCDAFPDAVDRFLQEKELKVLTRRKSSSSGGNSKSVKSKGIQQNITEFYRSTKRQLPVTGEEDLANKIINLEEDSATKEKRKVSNSNLPKSVRRRLLFNEQVFSIGNGAIGSAEFGALGVTVLVVDYDATYLAIVSKMLYTSGYRVITATHAADAMCILEEREDEVDLILTEIHLPDMDKYELLETLGGISSIPIVIFSADNDENTMLGCLFKGAAFYLLKPITMNDLKNLWQFSNIKKLEEKVCPEGSTSCEGGSPPYNSSYDEWDCISFSSAMKQNALKGKRKEPVEADKEADYDSSTLPKKPKLIWTNELHQKFLQALWTLGIDNAHPKKMLKLMNVPGLKKENISSHLQKYRLSLKREQDAIERTMLEDYDMSPFIFHGETYEFLNPQLLVTSSPEVCSHVQNEKKLSWSWSMPSLDSTNLPIFVESNHNDISIPRQNNEVLSSGGSNGIKSCSNEDLGIFDPAVRNDNSEELLKQSSTLSDVGSFGLDELLGNSSQEQQQFLLPPLSPLGWEQQRNDISGAELGDFEKLFHMPNSMFQEDNFSSIFDYPF